MNVTSVNRDDLQVASTVPADAVQVIRENRELVQAVKALNAAEMFGDDNQLMFQRDRQTQRMVMRVINRKTNEVISQIPPEYVLRLTRDLGASSSDISNGY